MRKYKMETRVEQALIKYLATAIVDIKEGNLHNAIRNVQFAKALLNIEESTKEMQEGE